MPQISCTPETTITLYVNYTSKKSDKKRNRMDWAGVKERFCHSVYFFLLFFLLGDYTAYSNNKIKNLKRKILREGPCILCVGGKGQLLFVFLKALVPGVLS